MSRFMVAICFLITLVTFVYGHIIYGPPRWQSCPRPPVQGNFSLTRFLGRWYELYTYTPGSTNPTGYKCYTIDYKAFNRTLYANGTQQISAAIEDSYSKISNAIGNFSTSQPAQINIIANGYVFYYWILETDYENYAVLWRCYNQISRPGVFPPPYTANAWILGRRNTLSQDIFDRIVGKLPSYGLQPEYLVKSVHDGSCTYPTCL